MAEFTNIQNDNHNSHLLGLMYGLNELMQMKGLAQSQAYIKHSVNISKYQAVYIFVSEMQILPVIVHQT